MIGSPSNVSNSCVCTASDYHWGGPVNLWYLVMHNWDIDWGFVSSQTISVGRSLGETALEGVGGINWVPFDVQSPDVSYLFIIIL